MPCPVRTFANFAAPLFFIFSLRREIIIGHLVSNIYIYRNYNFRGENIRNIFPKVNISINDWVISGAIMRTFSYEL